MDNAHRLLAEEGLVNVRSEPKPRKESGPVPEPRIIAFMEEIVALVERLKRGEDEVWNEFVHRYCKRLYGYFKWLGHDSTTSEELTQETFISAFCNIRRLRNAQALETWIFRIATNRSRREKRRRGQCDNARSSYESDPPDPGDGVLSDLEHADIQNVVCQVVERFPTGYAR